MRGDPHPNCLPDDRRTQLPSVMKPDATIEERRLHVVLPFVMMSDREWTRAGSSA